MAKKCFRVLSFLLIIIILFFVIGNLLQPVWLGWNNYSTMHGFYSEPKNTIETVFLGNSRGVRAITPMELYEKYGICAYNLSTEQQPLMVSYYLLQEAYRLHKESLKIVFLECNNIFGKSELTFYQKAIDSIKYPAKIKAVNDYPVEVNLKPFYYFPLTEYHTRWEKLTRADFEKSFYDPLAWKRGYACVALNCFECGYYEEYKEYYLNQSGELDESAIPSTFDEEGLRFLKKIVEFCRENGLRLVLFTTPIGTSSGHNAITTFAEQYGLDYLDFAFAPLAEEIKFDFVLDQTEGAHSNYYGASKITAAIGEHLIRDYGATDVRGDPRYAFMDDQLETYQKKIEDQVALKEADDLADYLEIAMRDQDRTVLLTVKDSANFKLDEETKEKLYAVGLTGLMDLEYREPYLAVIDQGTVVYERPAQGAGRETEKLTYEGILRSGLKYVMESGGAETGNISSCRIEGTEYSPNQRGINIVVYDNYYKEDDMGMYDKHYKVNGAGSIVDMAYFDTLVSTKRTAGYWGDLLAEAEASGTDFHNFPAQAKDYYLYRYEKAQRQKITQLKGAKSEGQLFEYLNAWWNDDKVVIYLASKGEITGTLDEETRENIAALGLEKLAQIQPGESWAAVVSNGTVFCEQRSPEGEPASLTFLGNTVTGRNVSAGDYSSILIDDTEQSINGQGINIAVYDTVLDKVVDRISFDTNLISAF